MRKYLLLLLTGCLMAVACRSTKTGCPTPRKNWGAEKVLEEMSAPGKKQR